MSKSLGKWSAKGLRSVKDAHPDDRLIFYAVDTAVLYRNGEVIATALMKSRDSNVSMLGSEKLPYSLRYDPSRDAAPHPNAPELMRVLGIMVAGQRPQRLDVPAGSRPVCIVLCHGRVYLASSVDEAMKTCDELRNNGAAVEEVLAYTRDDDVAAGAA